MAKTRVDEVLGRVGRDTEAIPRYDLVDQNGNTIATNVKLVLKNKIITAGMPVNKAAMDECLAASGTTAGSATAFSGFLATKEKQREILANMENEG